MSISDPFDNTDPRLERNKLSSLKMQLEKLNKDKARIEAAIKFLQNNPGALALVNSL